MKKKIIGKIFIINTKNIVTKKPFNKKSFFIELIFGYLTKIKGLSKYFVKRVNNNK